MGGTIDQTTSRDSGTDDPSAIEADIRETRDRLGSTVEEIGDRLNPQRLKQQLEHEIRDATIGRVENMAHQTAELVGEARHSIMETVRENPIPFALVGLGIGLLIWNNNQKAQRGQHPNGADSDDWRSDAASDGEGLFDRARDGAGDLTDAVKEKASGWSDSAHDAADHIADSAHHLADNVGDTAREQASQLQTGYQKNPLAFGAATLALGALAAFAIPTTAKEVELVGETRDQVVDKVQHVVDETKQKVQNVAGQVFDKAQTNAKEAAHEAGLMG